MVSTRHVLLALASLSFVAACDAASPPVDAPTTFDAPERDAPLGDAPLGDAPERDAPTDAGRGDGGADAPIDPSCGRACDDTDACNGVERCVEGECVAGTPVTCAPADPCHTSACVPATGACVATLVDADHDGEAAATLGACGTDCNDADATIGRTAREIEGDEIDQDCDLGEVCFHDDDGDEHRTSATRVSPDVTCKPGEGEAPASAPLDCNDADASIHPGASERVGDGVDADCDGTEVCFRDDDVDGFRTEVVATSADVDCADPGEASAALPFGDCCDIDGRAFPGEASWYDASLGEVACGGWDFDCSGAEERESTAGAVCTPGAGSVPTCMFGRAGWSGAAPACGSAGAWVTTCTGVGSCTLVTESREQRCR